MTGDFRREQLEMRWQQKRKTKRGMGNDGDDCEDL